MDFSSKRSDFPILARKVRRDRPLVYFDNAASTQRPTPVIEAMSGCYREYYANVHRGIHELSETASDAYERARERVREFIGAAEAAEVIFTGGTTAAINLVARSLSEPHEVDRDRGFLGAGDEILLTIFDHHSNIVPWQQAASRAQAQVRFCPLDEHRQFHLDVWQAQLSDRTRIVAFPAISNVLGDRLPVREMVQIAQSRGIICLVDAAQWTPHEPTNVADWGVDFVAFSGHKMLGPTGIGVLYGRREWLERMPPFLGGGSMIDRVTVDGFSCGELPAKFEAGTPPIVEAIGLGAAIDYLDACSLEGIAAHERALGLACRNGLASIDGLEFLSHKPTPDSGIISFVIDGCAAQDLAYLLDRQGFAVRAGHHCAMPLHDALGIRASIRASFYLYNTLDEVTRFVDAVKSSVQKLR
jgi:cysteine desulfurase/selenocysteine lyase